VLVEPVSDAAVVVAAAAAVVVDELELSSLELPLSEPELLELPDVLELPELLEPWPTVNFWQSS
jgi:hypothetical protein